MTNDVTQKITETLKHIVDVHNILYDAKVSGDATISVGKSLEMLRAIILDWDSIYNVKSESIIESGEENGSK